MAEAYRVFNMDVGKVVVIAADSAQAARTALPEAIEIGRLSQRSADQPTIALTGIQT